VSFRYLLCVLEIFNECPGDIYSVLWIYFTGVLKIFEGYPGDILSVSC